jgi:hypothetical protein
MARLTDALASSTLLPLSRTKTRELKRQRRNQMKQSMPNISSLTIGSRKSEAEGRALSNDSKQPAKQATPEPSKPEQSPTSVCEQTPEAWKESRRQKKIEKQHREKGKKQGKEPKKRRNAMPSVPYRYKGRLRSRTLLREKGMSKFLLRGLLARPEVEALPATYISPYDVREENLFSDHENFRTPKDRVMPWLNSQAADVWENTNMDTVMEEA